MSLRVRVSRWSSNLMKHIIEFPKRATKVKSNLDSKEQVSKLLRKMEVGPLSVYIQDGEQMRFPFRAYD